MFNFTRNQYIMLGVVALVVIILILLLTGLIPGFAKKDLKVVELNFMGFEDRRIFDPIITDFNKEFPNIKINYRRVNFDNYEDALLNSLAAGPSANGAPDIFMFRNTWLPKHFDKVTPASEDQFAISQFSNIFPTVAIQDFAPSEIIFASPLYIDTLALYYNKEIFDQEGIALPPKNWLEFQNLAARLRKRDAQGYLTRPGAAMGGSNNVHLASDILNLLFLQAGTPMVDDLFSRATFAHEGLGVLNFYLKFSDPKNDFYSWDKQLPFSLDLFANGTLPMMLHYQYQTPILRQRVPFLDFAVAPAPQPATAGPTINYADYYGLAVSARSSYPKEAWKFIIYLTTNPSISQKYLKASGRPPALRSLIGKYATDPELGVFAKQALTARSWPQVNDKEVEQSFNKMLESILAGELTARQAIRRAETEITKLMQKR